MITKDDLLKLGFNRTEDAPGWDRPIGEGKWLRWHGGQVYECDIARSDPAVAQVDPSTDRLVGSANSIEELRAMIQQFS